MNSRAALSLIIALGSSEATAQSVGLPPTPLLAYRDVQSEFALPPLKDAREGVVGRNAAHLQVIVRARRLGETIHSATEAWALAGGQFQVAQETANTARKTDGEVPFTQTKISQLNEALRRTPSANFKVTAPELLVDEPLILSRTGERINLGGTKLINTSSTIHYIVRIEHARAVTLAGGLFTGLENGVLISQSRDVAIVDGRFAELQGDGVVVTNSQGAVIWGNKISGLGRAPVLLHGSTTGSVVAENQIAEKSRSI